MTYQSLFHTTPFDEIVPFLPEEWQTEERIAALRVAYEAILAMDEHDIPADSEPDSKPIEIHWGETCGERYLSAADCDHYIWARNLRREVILGEGVDIPWAHAAALILWEQTFFGFTPEVCKAEIDFMEEDTDYQIAHGLTTTLDPKRLLDDDAPSPFDPVEEAKWLEWRRNRRAELGLPPDDRE